MHAQISAWFSDFADFLPRHFPMMSLHMLRVCYLCFEINLLLSDEKDVVSTTPEIQIYKKILNLELRYCQIVAIVQ